MSLIGSGRVLALSAGGTWFNPY